MRTSERGSPALLTEGYKNGRDVLTFDDEMVVIRHTALTPLFLFETVAIMLRASLAKTPKGFCRRMTTAAAQKSIKKEGDISDAFTSLSGAKREPLPDRFRELKCDLVRGREKEIVASWGRLLRQLRRENEIIAKKGPSVIPQVEFSDFEKDVDVLKEEIRKRGAVVIKGVIPEAEARAYKDEVEEYVKKNPSTRGECLSTLVDVYADIL